uniref:Diacylglycerol kinase n=1 Tax=Wollemia nobilis TaxID=56998 RepID=A0A0C9QX78_9CONI
MADSEEKQGGPALESRTFEITVEDEEFGETKYLTPRSSVVEPFNGCGLSGIRINKEELKKRLLVPEYLRCAIAEAVRKKEFMYDPDRHRWDGISSAPEAAIVVFVNSKSGGRHGPSLKARLQELMGEEQVFDLSTVKPQDFLQHGLGCLEKLASLGDHCAQETRDRIRIMVAGGDGSVGWVLGSIGELLAGSGKPIPPVGVIPLGTGNDLARSFNWGGSFPFAWKSAVKRSLSRAVSGPICRLDSWQVVMITNDGDKLELPYALKPRQQTSIPQDETEDGTLSTSFVAYGGLFYNYFSIGMDAQIAYGFHHLRNKKPYLARGPISNKMIYSGYSCAQGWFCTPFSSNPRVRGINNILQLHIKKINCSDWEILRIPSSVRAVVVLNLHNYASGRNPWGHPSPKYLEKRGFVEAHPDDGLLEIFGLKEGWHTTFVMIELIKAKHLAQAAAIRMELRGGRRQRAYMQMDGEPWKHPLSQDYSTMIEITKVPLPSLMISGE